MSNSRAAPTPEGAVEGIADEHHLPGAERLGEGIGFRKGKIPIKQEAENSIYQNIQLPVTIT